MLRDALRMLVNLRRERVLLLGHVAQLFDQRQVAIAFDVALRTRISIPVPGAAEVAPGLYDSDVFDAHFMEASSGQQSTEPSADDDNVDLVSKRSAGDGLDVRIVSKMTELAGDFDILRITVSANTA